MRDDITYSCVVDAASQFQLQAHYLVSSLIEVADVDPAQIVVHAAAEPTPEFARWLAGQGVDLVRVEPFPGHPYCNKLQQLATFEGRSSDYVALLDCDLFFTGPVPWPEPEAVAAKPVDIPVPPAAILADVFIKAGLRPEWTNVEARPGEETVTNNFNGGVYLMATDALAEIGPAWVRWANWCLEHKDLFGSYGVHVDQVAFALTLTELGITADRLGRQFNFPAHLDMAAEFDCTPHVLHYHKRFDSQFFLLRTGLPLVDQAITAANRHIEQWRRGDLLNSLFWGARYELFPQQGSGVGSRGDVLTFKQQMLRQLLEGQEDASVIEVGCGDGLVSSVIANRRYVGLDIAASAVATASQLRPDGRYEVGDLVDLAPGLDPADVVLCLDVLIHQGTRERYDRMIEALTALTTSTLIVSGYEAEPAYTSSLTHWYEPVTTSLERTGQFDEISVVSGYRDANVVVARRHRPDPHPRDIEGNDVTLMSYLVDDPLVFQRMVQLARRTLGFFPASNAKAAAYTWAAARLGEELDGQAVLDVHGGVSPLPLWLSARGAQVTTVDGDEVVRTLESRDTWTEHGFLDYGALDARIESHHVDFEAFPTAAAFDAVTCVHAIEHIPAAQRRPWIERFARHLKPGGSLLVSVEIEPWTDNLWTYRGDFLVEPAQAHGTLDDLVGELQKAGFQVWELRGYTHAPRSRTSIALIEARRG